MDLDIANLTLDELEAHLATVDSLEALDEIRRVEEEGRDRSGAYDLIEAARERIAPAESDYPAYDLGQANATFVVGRPDGEVEFTTNAEGYYTPTDEREVEALATLGAKPGRE
jgi:hypothetical protein